MAAYPATLPVPLQSGYEFNPDDALLRTQMAVGSGRVRRQTTALIVKVPVKWHYSAAQLALFEAWHSLTLRDGALWFDIDLANGLQLSTMQARFTRPAKQVALPGMNWEVSAELEVRQPPRLTQEYLDAALAYPPDELVYADPIFNRLVTTTLPAAGF